MHYPMLEKAAEELLLDNGGCLDNRSRMVEHALAEHGAAMLDAAEAELAQQNTADAKAINILCSGVDITSTNEPSGTRMMDEQTATIYTISPGTAMVLQTMFESPHWD